MDIEAALTACRDKICDSLNPHGFHSISSPHPRLHCYRQIAGEMVSIIELQSHQPPISYAVNLGFHVTFVPFFHETFNDQSAHLPAETAVCLISNRLRAGDGKGEDWFRLQKLGCFLNELSVNLTRSLELLEKCRVFFSEPGCYLQILTPDVVDAEVDRARIIRKLREPSRRNLTQLEEALSLPRAFPKWLSAWDPDPYSIAEFLALSAQRLNDHHLKMHYLTLLEKHRPTPMRRNDIIWYGRIHSFFERDDQSPHR
jgi:hypothetical protein